jgi:DNA-binding SARP family transcriptional activator
MEQTVPTSAVPPRLTAQPLIRRERLERPLDLVRERRLGLVIAEAGFGKTTLVAGWARSGQTAWYTLGARDASPDHLAQGVLGALRLLVPDLPEELARALAAPRGPDAQLEEGERAQAFAGLLCEALDQRLDRDLVLVLDDIDEIPAEGGAARLVEGLCLQAGPSLHLLLISRGEPPFPTARLRAQGEVVELAGRDLALAPPEIEELLEAAGQGGAGRAELLHQLTGGWPAATRLALESLRFAADGPQPSALGALNPGGPVFEALAEEAFGREPPAARELIRRGAVLGRVCGELCEEVGIPGAGATLESLLRRGLFFDADPHEPGWCVIVPLAAEFVRARHPLDAAEADQTRRDAAGWLEREGHLDAALRLAADAGEASDVVRLLGEHGEGLVAAGRGGAVIEADGSLPASERTPAVDRVVGRALQIRGDWEAALERLAEAAGDSDELEPGLAWRIGLIHHFRGDLAEADATYRRGRIEGEDRADAAALLAWHAALDWLRARVDDCRGRATAALRVATGAGDHQALACAHTVLAMLAAIEGDRAANDAHYLRALEHAERAGDVLQVIRIRTNRGSASLEEARYREAIKELDVALRLADLSGFAFFRALALSNRGQTLLLLGRLDEAMSDLEQSRRIYFGLGTHDVAYPLATIGDVHRERGSTALARAAYEEAVYHADEAGDIQGLIPALAGLARVLAADEPEEAEDRARQAVERASGMSGAAALLAAASVALSTDPQRCAELARQAGAAARLRRDRAGLAEALELEALGGLGAGAEALLREAIAIWTEIECPLGIARAELRLAGVVSGSEAEELLARATHSLNELGAAAYSREAGELEARLRDRAPPPLRLVTLGRFQLERDGLRVPLAEWRSKKARALLKILVARRGRPVHRERLMELLWPDDEPEKLANRLSVALSTLRGVLDPDRRFDQDELIAAHGEVIAVRHEALEVDVERFLTTAEGVASGPRSAEAMERLRAAEALYAGDFLEEDVYEDWAVPLREEARAAYVRVAKDLAASAREQGDPDLAERYLLRTLEKDPYDEAAHLELVGALAEARRHGAARRAYRVYASRMREIGVDPAPFPRGEGR